MNLAPPRAGRRSAPTTANLPAPTSARPTPLIDIAATEAGFAAAEEALFAGSSVNLTGVCSPRQVSAARAAHRRALARRLAAQLPVDRIACAASMPLTAIDRCRRRPAAIHRAAAARMRGRRRRPHRRRGGARRPGVRGVRRASAPRRWRCAGWRRAPPTAPPSTSPSFDGAVSAQAVLAQLARHGIDLDTIGNDLLRSGPDTMRAWPMHELLALPV